MSMKTRLLTPARITASRPYPRRRWSRLAALTAGAGLAAAALVSIPGAAASAAQCGSYPFRDPGLPLSTRTHDLLSRLTIVQKISFLFQYQPAIPAPLCLPMMKNGTEALHGDRLVQRRQQQRERGDRQRHHVPAGDRDGQHLGPRP